jgi:hypothetical protein
MLRAARHVQTALHCLADSCVRFLIRFSLPPTRKAFVSNIGNLILRKMFNTNQCVLCGAHSNEFIKLCLNSRRIAILGVLNNEHHQKSDDRRPCIDNQLPSVGVMENGACDGPHADSECCQQKRNRSPRLKGDGSRDVGESVLHLNQNTAAEEFVPECNLPQRLQSSSASRLTAGAFGFLTFTQCGEHPER